MLASSGGTLGGPAGLDWLLQGGALSILAYVVWWITRRFNGSIDRLKDAVERNTEVTREHGEKLGAAVERYTEALQRLEKSRARRSPR